MIVSLRSRVALLFIITADFMLFSRITLLPLIAMAIGAATVMLGIVASYRMASVLGLLVMVITAAASIEIESLLELGAILTALIALLLPTMMLIWLALSAEEGEQQQVSVRTKPSVIAVSFAFVCIWSAPLSVLVLSFFAPAVSMRVDVLAEMSIILVATIALGTMLLRKRPVVTSSGRPEGAPPS